MGRGGLEPPRPCGQQILSLSRLPFRHQPSYAIILTKIYDLCTLFMQERKLFIESFQTVVEFPAEKRFYTQAFQGRLELPVVCYGNYARAALA